MGVCHRNQPKGQADGSLLDFQSHNDRLRERNRLFVDGDLDGFCEQVCASLDRLGWAKSRLRGLWKVDCEGFMASITHNMLKAVRRLGSGAGPPEPEGSGDYAQFQQPVSSGDRCPVALVPVW